MKAAEKIKLLQEDHNLRVRHAELKTALYTAIWDFYEKTGQHVQITGSVRPIKNEAKSKSRITVKFIKDERADH